MLGVFPLKLTVINSPAKKGGHIQFNTFLYNLPKQLSAILQTKARAQLPLMLRGGAGGFLVFTDLATGLR